MKTLEINPYPAEFLKWTYLPSIFGAVHYQFWENQDKNLKVRPANSVEPSQTAQNAQAGLAVHWWQTLINFGSKRVMVNVLKCTLLLRQHFMVVVLVLL